MSEELGVGGPIRERDRGAIIQSLRAGVVPQRGQQYIQVGRADEVENVLGDLQRVSDGGSAIRFIIGEYGSGKTFFLYLMRAVAMKEGLVTAHADLGPDRRLHASGGQARGLYAGLMASLATPTKPSGGAIEGVVERFVSSARDEARRQDSGVEEVILQRLGHLSELPGGYDFAQVIGRYWRAYEAGDKAVQSDVVRWLRGEFSTRTDARLALGVRTIVDDENVYDHLKLFARFVRIAGFKGLLICLDEMVNLYKLGSGIARRNNYEQLLRIVNDSLQGASVGLGFLLSGTPEFLMDPRKGLYSYEALRSRLEANRFANRELRDLSGPVIFLANLTKEELFLLLEKLRHVYAHGDPSNYLIPEEGIRDFMAYCSERVGDAYFRTPRSTVKAFLDLLAVLEQNPDASWKSLLNGMDVLADDAVEPGPLEGASDGDGADDLTSFRL